MRVTLLAALLLLAASSGEINYTASSVNVAEAGTPVKIRILRWSTEDETRPIVMALAAPPAQPSDASRNAATAAGRGRAGRGRGRGGPALAPLSPIDAFKAALGRAPTVGYIWTNDITGYSIKYAWHTALADGTERVVLVSDRRLGAYTSAWKPTTSAAETDYTFTLIELHVAPTGGLEGKTSLTQKVVVDGDVKSVVLDNYPAGTVTLTGKPAAASPRPTAHP
jgi:hypothetical protein